MTTDSSTAFVLDAMHGLCCDGIPLSDIVARVGTPAYVYSAASIRSAWTRLDTAFAPVPHEVHYALKANSTLGILRVLRALGTKVDANSGGEIEIALRAGFAPADVVFTGVGKTPAELERAVALGLEAINAESPGELDRIDALAQARGVKARVAVRVNPDIAAGGHPHISTGRRLNKFGVAIERARDLYRDILKRKGLQPVGLHVHIGSQITDLDPLRRCAETMVELAGHLREDGVSLEHIDLGGGLGIPYDGRPVPDAGDYAAAILPVVQPTGLKLLLEPGRLIVGQAGVLVARIVDIKASSTDKPFVVLDAGMTDLLRPALYGAHHGIVPVQPRAGRATSWELVGPLCETSDTVGKDRVLPPLEVGDLVAVLDTGAYGISMASNYNRRMLPCEVLVDGDRWDVIRRRQTVDDLIRTEV